MVLGCNMAESYETMPQTVPSAGFTPPSSYDYSAVFAADSFDLSLLPGTEVQVPDCQQLLSLYCDTTSPHMFPTEDFSLDVTKLKSIKEEPFSPSPFYYQSPAVSPSANPINVKQEATIDLGAILQESRYLQEIYAEAQREQDQKKDFIIRSILERDLPEQKHCPNNSDHRLLREVLKDTSFQRKYNLKPFDLEGLGTAFKVSKMEEGNGHSSSNSEYKPSASSSSTSTTVVDLQQESFEPMISMAIEQLKEDVVNTCTVLGIPRDPTQWTEDDVRSWMLWNLRQYNHPINAADFFIMPGIGLVQLTEEEFQQRAPQCGSLLYAQLEIWKAACLEETKVDVSALLQDTTTQSSSSCGDDASDDDDDDETADSPTASSQASSSSGKVPSSRGGGGSHIHLWQFLKELLAQPQLHGSCIRWLDRSKGVFKIEDSVRVARLWGKRKNRPAMNYDKLSRSIRQYYKKGIMKKTERSQRLVYQFCHPYSL